MHKHAMWIGVLLAACGGADAGSGLPTDEALARAQERKGPIVSVERTGQARVPRAPQRAAGWEVREMERDFEAQRHKRAPHRSEKQLEELLETIVDTPPGRARQLMLGEYALGAHYLDKPGQRRAIARANEVLEGHRGGPR